MSGDAKTTAPAPWVAWVGAARPRTLPASLMPVLLGAAVAGRLDGFQLLPVILCALFALLIQIATNFANDYFDFIKGADTPERIGPNRAVASGWISPQAMWTATRIALALGVAVGSGLIVFGGWWLVIVGVASVAGALAYTAGPFPLAYRGWGDVFVVFFFGVVAVTVTVYVQTGTWESLALAGGLGIGLLINNLLVVNNHRDRETDLKAGKRTTVVRFGRRFGEVQYAFAVVGSLLAVGWVWTEGVSFLILGTALVVALFGFRHLYLLHHARTREDYGKVLVGTANTFILYAVLFSLGLMA